MIIRHGRDASYSARGGHHIAVCECQMNALYTLRLYSVICSLYLRKKKYQDQHLHVNLYTHL